MPIIIRHWLWS